MRKKWVAGCSIAALVAAAVVGVAHAQGIHTSGNIVVPREQTINRTYFAGARNIDIAGTINGDLICAGQNITVTGTITGDVLCAGQSVYIAGIVDGDVRAAGQNVTLAGSVQGNASAAGQDVTISTDAKIGRDTQLAGQLAAVNGSVGRDLLIGASDTTINGLVGRDVQDVDKSLALGSSAKISGNLTYTSTAQLTRSSGARINGHIYRHIPARNVRHAHIGSIIGGGLIFALILLVSLLATALVLALIMPRTFRDVTEVAFSKPWLALITGLLTEIAVPIVIATLMVTVIGIPLGILLLMTWVLLMIIAPSVTAFAIGRWLLGRSETNSLLLMLVGAVIILVLYIIPIIGILVSLIALWYGTGVIILYIAHIIGAQRPSPPKEPTHPRP